MTERATMQAHACCRAYSTKEWNSTILYRSEGTLEQGQVITVEEVIPHTIGTSGAADFNYAQIQQIVLERLTELAAQGRDLLDCNEGIMHSHNDMAVFFSGGDEEDLLKNAFKHNQYLSIVTNNRGQFFGYLAVRMYSPHELSYRDPEGVMVKWKGQSPTDAVGISELEIVVEEALENDFFNVLSKMKKTSYKNGSTNNDKSITRWYDSFYDGEI
jgi:hypothetical protein